MCISWLSPYKYVNILIVAKALTCISRYIIYLSSSLMKMNCTQFQKFFMQTKCANIFFIINVWCCDVAIHLYKFISFMFTKLQFIWTQNPSKFFINSLHLFSCNHIFLTNWLEAWIVSSGPHPPPKSITICNPIFAILRFPNL